MRMQRQMIVSGFVGLLTLIASTSESLAQCTVRNTMRSVAQAAARRAFSNSFIVGNGKRATCEVDVPALMVTSHRCVMAST